MIHFIAIFEGPSNLTNSVLYSCGIRSHWGHCLLDTISHAMLLVNVVIESFFCIRYRNKILYEEHTIFYIYKAVCGWVLP